MRKTILVFSGLVAAILILFQLGKYTMISGNLNVEIVVAVIAINFFLLEFISISAVLKTYRRMTN